MTGDHRSWNGKLKIIRRNRLRFILSLASLLNQILKTDERHRIASRTKKKEKKRYEIRNTKSIFKIYANQNHHIIIIVTDFILAFRQFARILIVAFFSIPSLWNIKILRTGCSCSFYTYKHYVYRTSIIQIILITFGQIKEIFKSWHNKIRYF